MNNTVALLINLPILFLVYLMIYFTQNLSGERHFYGISLNNNYFNKYEFKVLDKRFKLLITLGFIVFAIITLVLIYIFNSYIFASILPILGFCLYQIFIYVYIHNNVKALKNELALNISDLDIEKTNVVFDTEFMNEKNRIIKKFSIWFMIPTIVVVLIGTYVISQYNSIPDIIPTHWGISGKANAFNDKTFISILSQVLMMVGLGGIIYISSVGSLKSRAKLSIDDINKSKKSHLHYLNMLGFTFLILIIGCQVMLIHILISMYNASDVSPMILWPCIIVIILAAIYQTYLYYKSPSKSKDAVYSVDDEDCVWIFGCIYNNNNDPSLFVEKRFGVGWTVNIGTTAGKLLFILPFAILLIILLLI